MAYNGFFGYGLINDLQNFFKSMKGAFTGSESTNTAAGESNQSGYSNANDVLLAVQNGTLTAMEAYAILSQYFPASIALNPNIMKMLNQLMARENTANAQDYEKYLMQNSLLWNASQLNQLGLSNSGVLATGSSIPSVAPAQTDFTNPAEKNLQALSSLAGNFISMAGRMANAGIYGSALRSVKNTAAKTASMSANSANKVGILLKHSGLPHNNWDEILDDIGDLPNGTGSGSFF